MAVLDLTVGHLYFSAQLAKSSARFGARMSESSGSALMEGSSRHRWLISAAIVLLLHVCIAAAVLTWRHVTSALPLLIDLTPSPSASEQTGARPAPLGAGQASHQQSAPEQKTESASASAPTEPGRPQISALPRGTAAKNDSEAADGTGSMTISGRGVSHASESAGVAGRPVAVNPAGTNVTIFGPVASNPASTGPLPVGPGRNSPINRPMANMPLDTSITVQPPLHGNGIDPFNHGEVGPLASRESGPDAAPFDQRPRSIFRPAKPFGVPNVPRNSLLPNGNAVLPGNYLSPPGVVRTNPPGAYVQDRARAAMARAMGHGEPIKNAIGGVVGSGVANSALHGDRDPPNGAIYGVGRSMTNIASRGDLNSPSIGIARNSVGVTANFRPLIPRAGQAKAATVALAGHEMPTAPVINGHDPGRSISSPGFIGGPARRSGILSGSDFGLRRP